MANIEKDASKLDEKLLQEVTANLDKVPYAAQTVMIQCQSALHWGGNWSLIGKDDKDYKAMAELMPEIKEKYSKTVRACNVRGGALIEADPNWLIKILTTLAPTYSASKAQEYLTRVTETQTTEGTRFSKYWKRTIEGKTDMFNAKDDKGNARIAGTLGVYCTNVNTNVTVNGITYPAFKLSPARVCNEMTKLPNSERIMVAVYDKAGTAQWVPLREVIQNNLYNKTLSFPVDFNGAVINRPNALLMRFAVK